jgi:hypothetical protein
MSQQGQFINTALLLNTLTGNAGGAITPDLGGNFNIVGAGGLTVTGVPATHTLTITGTGLLTAARSDLGVGFDAVPSLGIINFLGGTNINTTSPGGAPGNTLTINLNDNVNLAGYLEAATTIGTINGSVYSGNTQNNTSGAEIDLTKIRGANIVQQGDTLGSINFFGFDGALQHPGADIVARVLNPSVPAVNKIPTDLEFWTAPDAVGTPIKRLTIGYDGGITVHTFTNGVVLSGATGLLSSLDTGAIGTVLTSSAGPGAAPTWQAIAIPSAFTWHTIVANQDAVADEGYICNGGGTIQVRLPAVFAAEKTFRVTGRNNVTGWRITQQAGQQIHWDAANATTAGAGGYLESTDTYDAVELLCTVANTTWQIISSKGNPTIV